MRVVSGRIDKPVVHFEAPPGEVQRHSCELNDRQMKMIRRILSAGPDGFEGGINVRKYMAVTRASKATATRDLQHLATIRALETTGHGRATRYQIVLNPGEKNTDRAGGLIP